MRPVDGRLGESGADGRDSRRIGAVAAVHRGGGAVADVPADQIVVRGVRGAGNAGGNVAAAVKAVVALAGGELIVAVAAVQGLITIAGEQSVLAGVAVELVAAA